MIGKLYLLVFLFPILLPFSILILIYLILANDYKKTEYYSQTHNPLINIWLNKGVKGEYRIYQNLSCLPGNKRFLFNCYIPKPDGSTTELDVIFVHDSGIYVFESKNYGGRIFGSESEKQWTQVLPAGRWRTQKFRFFNPVMQNKTHVKWLKKYMKQECLPIYSCVVFSDRCDIRSVHLDGDGYVMYRRDVSSVVASISGVLGQRLSEEEIEGIYERLYPLTQVSDCQKTAHIQYVREAKTCSPSRIAEKAEKVCPECGSPLVIRKAKKGRYEGKEFWGCSSYPECKHISKISDF